MLASTYVPSEDGLNVFPSVPNWKDKVRISYEYKTDIITSGEGTEQRRAVRYYPRRSVEFSAIFTGESKLHLDWFMVRGLADKAAVIEPSKYVTTRGVLEPKQRQISYTPQFDPFPNEIDPPYWMRTGIPVMLVDGLKMEVRTLSGYSRSDVQFAEESTLSFSPGTRIYPALLGHIRPEPLGSRITNETGTLAVRFDVDPGSETFAPTAAGELLDGREIFMKRANWSNGVDATYVYQREDEDYGFGAISHFKPYDFASRIIKGSYVGKNHREVKEVVDFFMRMRGRQKDFFLPSWENDIPFYAISGNGFAILVEGRMFGHTYKDSTVFRRIMLRMTDGSYRHHMVDFIEVLDDTDFSVLWVRERLPVEELTPQSLIGISWVFAARFASDLLDIDWLTDSVAQFGISFQLLENFDL